MRFSADHQQLIRDAANLERAGDLTGAQASYQQLLALHPDLPDCWYNLALLQRRLGSPEAALTSYQQALERGVMQPEHVHLNCAVIFSDYLHRYDAAEAALHAALKCNRHYVPALLNLENLYEDLGRLKEAIALCEAILEQDKQHCEALARYANLQEVHDQRDPLIERLRTAMQRPSADAADRALVGFALGKVLDSCGAYDAAFAAYQAANQCSRASARVTTRLFDRQQHTAFIDRIIRTFSESDIPTEPSAANAAPVFICGMFRSGSTLLEQMLANHPRVATCGELSFIPELARSELAPFPEGSLTLPPEIRVQVATRYWRAACQYFQPEQVLIDKRPDNFLYIGLIKKIFPAAKFIVTQRHILDNCLSVYFLHLDHSMGYALDLTDTGHYYLEHKRLMTHWQRLFDTDVLELSYDALVNDPRQEIARALEFFGLPWDDACLNVAAERSAVKTASLWQVRKQIYQHSSGRWRNYRAHIEELARYVKTDLNAGRMLDGAR